MAKKEKEFIYKDASLPELNERLEKTSAELFKLKFRAASAPVKNPMQIRQIKREIARIHTFIQQRTVSQNGPVDDVNHRNGRANG
jgi:large subunit ribosomal protein L29